MPDMSYLTSAKCTTQFDREDSVKCSGLGTWGEEGWVKGFVFLLNVGALVYTFFFHHGRYTGSCTVHLQGGYDTLMYTVSINE